MTLPPPRVVRRIRKLHALLGSSNANEADSARKKLNGLLTEYGLTWNDLPAILSAADTSAANTSAPRAAPTDRPEVNVLDLVLRLIELHTTIRPAERMAVALWI